MTLRAPAPKIISLEASHRHARPALKEPRVKLFPAGKPEHSGGGQAEVTVDKHTASISAPGGGARAEMDLTSSNFGVKLFNGQGDVATYLGYQSIQWAFHTAAPSALSEKENATNTTHDIFYRAPAARTSYMSMAIALRPDEKVYGFGERFGAFVKNGQVVESSNEDGGTSSSSGGLSWVPCYAVQGR